MKLTKKKVFVAAIAICLIAIVSVGTLAWFSDSKSVTNNFLVAGSEDEADKIFSVKVWEKTPESDEDTDGYDYTNILPGSVYKKEAHVENTGLYDQYIRVTVTISDAQAWVDALGANFDVADVFVGFDATKWTHIWNNMNGATTVPSDLVYVMYYKDVLESGKDITVFTDVKIPESLDQEDVAKFGGSFSIDVKADAVQTENVVPDGTAAEDAAWAAFKTVEE